jgi:hypothetical protein
MADAYRRLTPLRRPLRLARERLNGQGAASHYAKRCVRQARNIATQAVMMRGESSLYLLSSPSGRFAIWNNKWHINGASGSPDNMSLHAARGMFRDSANDRNEPAASVVHPR